MSWQCLRCGGIDRHLTGCPDLTVPLVITIPAISEKAVVRMIGPSGEEKVYIAKDELDRLRAVAEAAKKLYMLHKENLELEVDDLQRSRRHIDAEDELFAVIDALEEANRDA